MGLRCLHLEAAQCIRGLGNKIICHRREKSHLLLSCCAIENTVTLLPHMNFEAAQWHPLQKTTTDDAHADRYFAHNIVWSVLTLVCYFHFSSHDCRWANTTRPDLTHFSGSSHQGKITAHFSVPHHVCF